MSCNGVWNPGFVYKKFTINDLNALASLWGIESDQSSPLATRVPFPIGEDCDSPDLKNDFSITTKLPVEYPTKGDDYLLANEINANLYGAGGDDTIIGSKGRDTLGGGPGNDVLDGGPGKDMLYGHKGRDHFVISEGEGKDKIHFFEQGIDIVHVKHSGGRLALAEVKGGLSILLDGNHLATMKNVEFIFGPCSEKLAVIDNQFIA